MVFQGVHGRGGSGVPGGSWARGQWCSRGFVGEGAVVFQGDQTSFIVRGQ